MKTLNKNGLNHKNRRSRWTQTKEKIECFIPIKQIMNGVDIRELRVKEEKG